MADKLAPDSRHSVVFQDRVVYQWSQTISEVDVFVPLPQDQKLSAKALYVNMQRSALEFGIKGTDPYMQVRKACYACAARVCLVQAVALKHVTPATPRLPMPRHAACEP